MPKVKTKPQGKINPKIVAEGLLKGKKKVDIAKEAGSIAKDQTTLINNVNRVAKSSEVRALLAAAAEEAVADQLRIREELQDSKKDYAVRSGVNKDLLDRGLGKATDHLDVTSKGESIKDIKYIVPNDKKM